MKTICDIIEEFILSSIGEDTCLELNRNELAQLLSCSPSQINYVLTTRFTLDKGYSIASKRGGGGYIKITKIHNDGLLENLINESIGGELPYVRVCHITDRLVSEDILSEKEGALVKLLLSDKALKMPLRIKDNLRANMYKLMLEELLKG